MADWAKDFDYIGERFPFSHGERENLKLWLGELAQWGFSPLREWWTPPRDGLKGKDLRRAALRPIREKWLAAKEEGPRWPASGGPDAAAAPPLTFEEIRDGRSILGSCPVASDRTRCCRLLTLDAVFRCAFDCSYCSIQSFYSEGKISFHANLGKKLARVESELDPDRLYHIGTGQSSDSLLWGNRKTGDGPGLLEELFAFARRNPRVMLELKSKSDNMAWVAAHRGEIPFNVIFTWSLNPPPVIEWEERGTAPLERRLEAAGEAAAMGLAVGFHFHPMILYRGWKRDYASLFSHVLDRFSPEEVVQVSLGTLTFIKPVLKKIRSRDFNSQILRMPLEETAGKFSYPLAKKRELFSFAYDAFGEWHDSDVFFYLCMEDEELWEPVLGRRYGDNGEFEKDMLTTYYEKLHRIGNNIG